MTDSAGISFLLHAVGMQIPVLAACVVGIILAIVFFQRSPAAMIFCMIGLLLLMLTTVGTALAQSALIQSQYEADIISRQSFATMMTAIGIGGNCLRALATALLVAAVFIGRNPSPAMKG